MTVFLASHSGVYTYSQTGLDVGLIGAAPVFNCRSLVCAYACTAVF